MSLVFIFSSKLYKRYLILIIIICFILILKFISFKTAHNEKLIKYNIIYTNLLQIIIGKNCTIKNKIYCIYNNFWIGNTNYKLLSLTTHCSLNNLYHLYRLLNSWSGTVSVSIFIYEYDTYAAINLISHFIACNPKYAARLSIHLIGKNHKLDIHLDAWKITSLNCSSILDTTSTPNYATIVYPNNLLRNIALRNAYSEYVFPVDVDVIPSPRSDNLISRFLTRTNQHHRRQAIAYVLPVFEKRTNTPMPSTKDELILFSKLNNVRFLYYILI